MLDWVTLMLAFLAVLLQIVVIRSKCEQSCRDRPRDKDSPKMRGAPTLSSSMSIYEGV